MSDNALKAVIAVAWAAAFSVVGVSITQCAMNLPDINTLKVKCIEARGNWETTWGGGACVMQK